MVSTENRQLRWQHGERPPSLRRSVPKYARASHVGNARRIASPWPPCVAVASVTRAAQIALRTAPMEALESAIASRASRALSLPSTNMALGRKLVAAGLSTSSQTAFDDALQQYGQVDRATRTELFQRIRQHARDAAAAKRAAADDYF